MRTDVVDNDPTFAPAAVAKATRSLPASIEYVVDTDSYTTSERRGRVAAGVAAAALFVGTGAASTRHEGLNIPELVRGASRVEASDSYGTTGVETVPSEAPPTTVATFSLPNQQAASSEARAATSSEYVTMYGEQLLVPSADLEGQALLDVLEHNHRTALFYLDERIDVEDQLQRGLEMVELNLSQKADPKLRADIARQFRDMHNYHRGDPLMPEGLTYRLESLNDWRMGPGGKSATVLFTVIDNNGKRIPKTMTLVQETTVINGYSQTVWQIAYISLR